MNYFNYRDEVVRIIKEHEQSEDWEKTHVDTDDLLFRFLEDLMTSHKEVRDVARELLKLKYLERWYS